MWWFIHRWCCVSRNSCQHVDEFPSSSEHTGVSSVHIHDHFLSVCDKCNASCKNKQGFQQKCNQIRDWSFTLSTISVIKSLFFSVSEKQFSIASNLPKAEACRLCESTSQWVVGSIDGAGRALALYACPLMHVRLVFISLQSLPSTSCTGNHSFGFTSTTYERIDRNSRSHVRVESLSPPPCHWSTQKSNERSSSLL